MDQIESSIRKGVLEEFKPRPGRGLGYGVVFRVKHFHKESIQFSTFVDKRNRRGGVWQWGIVISEEEKALLGIHTWVDGYLRPVYDSIIQQYVKLGYEHKNLNIPPDPLIAKLVTFLDCFSIGNQVNRFLNFLTQRKSSE